MTKVNPQLELTRLANELKTLDRAIVKDVLESQVEDLLDHIANFMVKRKELKLNLLHFSSFTVHDKTAQIAINKVINDDPFQADTFTARMSKDSRKRKAVDIAEHFCKLKEDELEELTRDHLYPWFRPYGYIEDLYEIGALILGINVPANLATYVSEARQSYAFQNYLAVYGICRTILETAVRDIGQRKRLLPRDKGKTRRLELRNWSHMKKEVVPYRFKEEINDIYDTTSGLIHGHKTVEKIGAKNMLRRTLETVQKLYELHRLS